jgi:hypothetical protein
MKKAMDPMDNNVQRSSSVTFSEVHYNYLCTDPLIQHETGYRKGQAK